MTMPIKRKQLATLAKFVAFTQARTVLDTVKVEPTRILTTNGHYLAIQSVPEGTGLDALLDGRDVQRALKGWDKKKLAVSVDTERTEGNGRVYFVDETIPSIAKMPHIPPHPGASGVGDQYPSVDKVIPTGEPAYRVALNPADLELIGNAAKGERAIILELPKEPLSAMSWTAGDLRIILAPLATENPGIQQQPVLAQWVERLRKTWDMDTCYEG